DVGRGGTYADRTPFTGQHRPRARARGGRADRLPDVPGRARRAHPPVPALPPALPAVLPARPDVPAPAGAGLDAGPGGAAPARGDRGRPMTHGWGRRPGLAARVGVGVVLLGGAVGCTSPHKAKDPPAGLPAGLPNPTNVPASAAPAAKPQAALPATTPPAASG